MIIAEVVLCSWAWCCVQCEVCGLCPWVPVISFVLDRASVCRIHVKSHCGSWDTRGETRNVILMNYCTLAHFCNSQFCSCLSQCVFCFRSRGRLNIPKHSIIKIADEVYWQSQILWALLLLIIFWSNLFTVFVLDRNSSSNRIASCSRYGWQ